MPTPLQSSMFIHLIRASLACSIAFIVSLLIGSFEPRIGVSVSKQMDQTFINIASLSGKVGPFCHPATLYLKWA